VADIGKAQRLLGYAPRTTIADGLAAQLAWQKQAASLLAQAPNAGRAE
jgi:nucleoside-diphosphate-sugar epimerase